MKWATYAIEQICNEYSKNIYLFTSAKKCGDYIQTSIFVGLAWYYFVPHITDKDCQGVIDQFSSEYELHDHSGTNATLIYRHIHNCIDSRIRYSIEVR